MENSDRGLLLAAVSAIGGDTVKIPLKKPARLGKAPVLRQPLRRHAVVAAVLLVSMAGFLPAAPHRPKGDPDSSERHIYHYRMKGKIRLLFFWIGKDNVGGGHISIERTPGTAGDWSEEIAVLFGSNPERVPGRVNRWGYGWEQARWTPSQDGQARLTETVFEGFMRHSSEEKMSDVRKNARRNQAEGSFAYDGTRSHVGGEAATSQIRIFSTAEDFDYRNPDPVFCGYQTRLKAGPPDRSKRLDQTASNYTAPLGFLTAIRQATQTILNGREDEAGWKKQRPVLHYVYNARAYELAVTGLKMEKKFKLPLEDGQSRLFRQVVKAEFKVRRLSEKHRHSFTIWFPANGPLRGVPLRIEDKPRWWLRVVLNLIPDRTQSGAEVARNDPVDCSDGHGSDRNLADRTGLDNVRGPDGN